MRSLLLIAILAAAPACTGDDTGDGQITVFAAASLTEVFTALAEHFERDHSDADVTLSFAGSQQLVAQIEQGAEPAVLATADEDSMAQLDVPSEVFAANRLAIIVEPLNPLKIRTLSDLARPDVTLVLAAPEVPAGRYASEILDRAGVDAQPKSLEENVKAVVTRISLGEADAGIAYVTDVRAAEGVESVDIPEEDNVEPLYPIALLDTEDNLASAFVDLVLSAEGREIIGRFGFVVPSAP